jgi:hypothetical protein
MDLDEIEELIYYNKSYNVSVLETLELINRLDLIEYFDFEFE